MLAGQVNDIAQNIFSQPTSATNRAKLAYEDFMKILIAELSNQDPLEPLKNQEFLSQITQLHNLEAVSSLTDGIKGLVMGYQIGAASSMIGKVVIGMSDDQKLIEGVVERVLIDGEEIRLIVDGEKISMSNVQEILPGKVGNDE